LLPGSAFQRRQEAENEEEPGPGERHEDAERL